MCATIKSLDLDKPDKIEVFISIPRSTTDFSSICESLPELELDLAKRWPVESIGLARRNPVNLMQWEIYLIVGLSTPILKPLGEKLRDEVFKWLRKRFAAPAKRKRRTASHRRRS
jgi:hypothetical protein